MEKNTAKSTTINKRIESKRNDEMMMMMMMNEKKTERLCRQ